MSDGGSSRARILLLQVSRRQLMNWILGLITYSFSTIARYRSIGTKPATAMFSVLPRAKAMDNNPPSPPPCFKPSEVCRYYGVDDG
jgi:hypothetical protein